MATVKPAADAVEADGLHAIHVVARVDEPRQTRPRPAAGRARRPPTESIRLSISRSRMRRMRPPPRAVRIANSLLRDAARATSRPRNVHAGNQQYATGGAEQRIQRRFVVMHRVVKHGSADDTVMHGRLGMGGLDLFLQSVEPSFKRAPAKLPEPAAPPPGTRDRRKSVSRDGGASCRTGVQIWSALPPNAPEYTNVEGSTPMIV